MVQSTNTRPPPTTSAPTPREPEPSPTVHQPGAAAAVIAARQQHMAMATDRNLLDQLRLIFQTANRHLPVPSSTVLSKSLEDALDEIAKIAERAVEAYKPPT